MGHNIKRYYYFSTNEIFLWNILVVMNLQLCQSSLFQNKLIFLFKEIFPREVPFQKYL
jgi:hypothetical protein